MEVIVRDRETFLAQRRDCIGGSDIAPILGLSKWRTALDVYLEKRGLVEDSEETARQEMGRYLEAPILQWYADTHNLKLTLPAPKNDWLRVEHPEVPWLVGNLDALVDGEHGDTWVADAKNVHWRAAREWGAALIEDEESGEVYTERVEGDDAQFFVPTDVTCQMQAYCEIVDVFKATPVALLGGDWPPRVFTVLKDAEFWQMILPTLEKFWWHVETGTPPEPDFGAAGTLDALKILYPPVEAERREVELSPEWVGHLANFDLLRQLATDIEKRKKVMDAQIRAELGDGTHGMVEGSEIVYRSFVKGTEKRKAYDTIRLKWPKGEKPKLDEYKRQAAQAAGLLEGEQ